MKRYMLFRGGCAFGAISLATISPAAFAQDVPAEENESGGLEEIIVTAQRKPESLQDTAIPINVATAEDLTRAGVADSTALNRIAPALYVTQGGGANTGFFVRGVGNFTNNGYTNPAVAFNVDGVYIGRPSSTIVSFLDVGAVEVLKGPQGTLYGRNATGGAINVLPKRPELGETSARLSASYGNYDAVMLEGAVNLPIGDDGAIRIASLINRRDGYNADGTDDARDFAIRGQLYVEPSDNFNIRLSVDYATQTGIGAGTTILGNYNLAPPPQVGRLSLPVPGWNLNPAPANVSAPNTGLHTPASLAFTSNIFAAPLFSSFSGYAYPFRDDSYFGTNAEINFDLGAVDLVVIPAYRRSELDNQFNGPPFKAAINQDTAEQFSLEGRLSGTIGPVDWLAGAFYFDERVKGVNSFNQFSTVTHNRFDSSTESLAIFGRATFNLSDSLRLVGGLRYTDENRSIDAFATSTAGVCRSVASPPRCNHVPTIPVGLTLQDSLAQLPGSLFPVPGRNPSVNFNPSGTNGVGQAFPYGPLNFFAPAVFGPGALIVITPNRIQQSAGDSEITYRAAIEYDLTSDNLLYASFENGFRAGGFNVARGRETYDPEYIDAYTLGMKNRFMNNRLEINLELFLWKYRGQQLSALGVDSDGNNAFFTRNVGRSTNKGAEIDFQFLATDTTRLRGGVQYLDATYDQFSFNQRDLSAASDPPNFLLPVTGCRSTQVLAPVRSFDVDCSGKQALNSPKWSANFGIEQVLELGDYKITGTVDGRYRSGREVSFAYIPAGRIGGDINVDASLELAGPDDRWSINAFVRNLTNERVLSVVQVGAGNIVGGVHQPPRTYGLRATVNF